MDIKQKKHLYTWIIRGFIPSLTGVLYYTNKSTVNLYLVKVMLFSLVISVGLYIFFTAGVFAIQTFVDLANEGIVGVIAFSLIVALLLLRIMGYGEFNNVMPFLLKALLISIIIYFIEVKLLKINYHKI